MTKLAWRLPRNSRDRLMLRLVLPSPLTGTRQFVASSLHTRADNQNNQSLLTGTVTTQSPLTGTGAIQSPLVGIGTFQSNSPVGVGSVHDIHASNIDINAQARTEMSSNPFMWMFNMPNQQDFVDKRVQEALNPTLLRSAATSATFISNTTTSVSTSVSCTANTTSQLSQMSDVGLTSSPIIMIMRMSRKTSPSFQFWLVTSRVQE